jgi:hydrogenase expression/formation protein HypE
MVIREDCIPVSGIVDAACEILGLNPIYIANEGRFVAFLPASQAQRALELLRERHPKSQPAVIGEVTSEREAIVIAQTPLGTERVVDMLSGDQLPRIC